MSDTMGGENQVSAESRTQLAAALTGWLFVLVLFIVIRFTIMPARIGMHADVTETKGHGMRAANLLAFFNDAIIVDSGNMLRFAHSGVWQFPVRCHIPIPLACIKEMTSPPDSG